MTYAESSGAGTLRAESAISGAAVSSAMSMHVLPVELGMGDAVVAERERDFSGSRAAVRVNISASEAGGAVDSVGASSSLEFVRSFMGRHRHELFARTGERRRNDGHVMLTATLHHRPGSHVCPAREAGWWAGAHAAEIGPAVTAFAPRPCSPVNSRIMNTRTALIGSAAVLVLAVAGGAAWTERARFMPRAGAVTQGETSDAPDERLPVPPVPQRIASGEDYEHCMGMLASDPAGANAFADAWEATGGGDGATHCHALAQIELGSPSVGADMLEALARNSKGPALARAAIYGQAGQAWLMASQPDRAFASTTLALAITPDDPDLLIERAIADGQLDRYQDAADDLDQALAADPKRADALTYRAAARRHLNQLDAAQDDIDEALTLDPQNPESLLERGIIRERTGNPAGARDDWQNVTTLAPDSPTADLAQQNLALLDAGPERR
jgi:hypothetical protein